MNHPLQNKPDISIPTYFGNHTRENWLSVLYFDPNPLIRRLGPLIDPFRRHQSLTVAQMWPNEKGICACGCGESLVGRQTRWRPHHDWTSVQIFSILQGHPDIIRNYIWRYWGHQCLKCLDDNCSLFLDHRIPVKHGGGGSWLSNYQLLCGPCHRIKTNSDFGWKGATVIPDPDQFYISLDPE